MSYEIVWENKGVLKRYFGCMTGKELLQGVYDICGSVRFDEIEYVIYDFLNCKSLAVSDVEAIEAAAIEDAAHYSNPKIRIAVVADDPQTIAIASRYASDATKAYPTCIFPTVDDARAWLMSSPFKVGRTPRI
jgi:hypothetical protein